MTVSLSMSSEALEEFFWQIGAEIWRTLRIRSDENGLCLEL